jgi:ubiquinone/menaquinone biosynthesis C-methylase UbiE
LLVVDVLLDLGLVQTIHDDVISSRNMHTLDLGRGIGQVSFHRNEKVKLAESPS